MHISATEDDRRIFARLMPVERHARYLGADRSAAHTMRQLLGAGSLAHRSTHDALAFQGLGDGEIVTEEPGPWALAGWGYDAAGGNFRRLAADVSVRLAPEEYAKPGSVIAYRLDTGERMHIPKRAIVQR